MLSIMYAIRYDPIDFIFIKMELEQFGIMNPDEQEDILSNPKNWLGLRDDPVSDLERLLRDIGKNEIMSKDDNRVKLDNLLKDIVIYSKGSGLKYRKGNIEDANNILKAIGLKYYLDKADRYTHRAWKVYMKPVK